MNMKFLIGLAVAFGVGALCRLFDVPVPAPPALLGALLVMSMTIGYECGERFMVARARRRPGSDT